MTEIESAWHYILVAEGLRFCTTGEDRHNTLTMYEKARVKFGDDFLVQVKSSVETLHQNIHPERVAELWGM